MSVQWIIGIATIMATSVIVAVFLCIMVSPITPAVQLRTSDNHINCLLPNEFTLKWRHSVEKQYWQEVYIRQDNALLLQKTYVQSFGAGVPTTGKPTPAPKGYVGQWVNWQIPEINWVISANMQGEILMGDLMGDEQNPHRRFALYQILPDYTEVNISPQKLTLWQAWRIKQCNTKHQN